MKKTDFIDFQDTHDLREQLQASDLEQLTQLLTKYAPHDAEFVIPYTNVRIIRASQVQTEQSHLLSVPSICIVPQGAKLVAFGNEYFEYDETKMVVYAAEIPINVRIIKATKEAPYFCMVIPIDPHRLNELSQKVFSNGLPKTAKTRAVYVGDVLPKLFKSALRMMEMIIEQEDIDLLVPLIIDEMMIRLLRSPVGSAIAQISMSDSHAGKVTKAITWLKNNYAQPVKMEDLAKIAGMSVSAFHTHFKEITSLSPLQFQKTLRLEEARLLIRNHTMDISNTAYAVGYVSPTQFSREYNRYFGVPPSKDLRI